MQVLTFKTLTEAAEFVSTWEVGPDFEGVQIAFVAAKGPCVE